MNNEDKKYEKIGEVIFTLSYWFYALKFIIAVSIPAVIVMIVIGKPFWIGILIGIGAWFVYRSIRRAILRFFIKLSYKAADNKSEDNNEHTDT